jgi:tetratricopeptide (TPR) repeat protein
VNDVPLIVQIQATLGQALAAACDYDRALALLDAAIEEKRQHRSQKRPSVGLAYSLACKASVLGHRARFADAHLCFDEAIDAVRGSGHEVEGSVVCWRSAVYAWQGRWAEAHECALIAQGIAERVRTLYVFGMSRALAGYAGWMLDRQSAALQALADATSWLETHDKRLFISLNYGWLADAMVETGDHAAARLYGARALARARKRDRLGEAMACRALARCALSGGARRSPLSYLTRATRVAKELRAPQELALTQMCEAEVAAAGGDRLRGCSLLHEAAGTLQALEMFWHQREAQRRVAALQPAH